MAVAKKNGSTKSKTQQSNKTAATKNSTAQKKSAPQKTTAPKTKQKQPAANSMKAVKAQEDRRFWSYILFFFGIFELILTFVSGDGLWYKLHCLNRGLFGVGTFLFAPMIIYVSLMIASDRAHNTVVAKVVEGTVLMLLFSGIIQILQVGSVDGGSF